ncbi:MAG: hypothetical protein LBU90_02555, partial [Bacteroidales bacterium]|nr:hypothetical protein [Bacteroidales bacterium]
MKTKHFLRSIVCAVSALLLCSTSVWAQANLTISGGNSVSSYICSNTLVAVWGKNDGGRLGAGAIVSIVTSPTIIPKASFNNEDMKQVNSGSGGHFVALSCTSAAQPKSHVWSWGGNDRGQVGNGVKGGIVSAPVRVRAGSGIDAAFKETVAGVTYLIDAKVVYAGNASSYAILSNGDLVSWGGNGAGDNQYTHTYGILGNGTQTDSYEAAYVLTGAGQRLKNVVMVCAGDNAAYALDASGQVWSWGWSQGAAINGSSEGNGALGRAAGQTNYATKISYAGLDGSGTGFMNNIKYLSCSDGVGYAIDNDDYVWGWGNGGWDNQLGPTGNPHGSGWKPRKIRDVVPNGGTYDPNAFLKAKQVAGGQGFGMAVTMDDRAVVWGGDKGCNAGGGGSSISTEGDNTKGYTRYINSTANTTGNIFLINRADHGGWFITMDNKIYAFGCNTNSDAGVTGMLGLGYKPAGSTTPNTDDAPTPFEITLPISCGAQDLAPMADISPKLVEICKTQFAGQELKSGFSDKITAATILTKYTITWYYQAPGTTTWTQVKSGKASTNSNKILTVAEMLAKGDKGEGRWKVEVEYTGTNAPCGNFPPAADSMEVKFFKQEYKDPTNLSLNCTTKKATVWVAPNAPAVANDIKFRVYNWYAAEVGGTALATTTGGSATTGSGTAPAAPVSAVINDISTLKLCSATTLPTGVTCPTPANKYRVAWVEESAAAAGTFIKRSSAPCQTTNRDVNLPNPGAITGFNNTNYTGFTVYETVTITESKLFFMSSLYNVGASGSGTVTLGIYKAGTNSNTKVPTGTAVGTLVTDLYERTRGSEVQDLMVELIAKGSVTLAPGEYFIGPSAYSGTGLGNPKVFATSCTLANSGNDDVNQTIIKFNLGGAIGSNGNQSNFGHMAFDIKFQTAQRFCDRVPVFIEDNCPDCTVSKDIAIQTPSTAKLTTTPDGAGTIRTINLCKGESVALSTNDIMPSPAYTPKYTIRWIKAPVNTATYNAGTGGTGLKTETGVTTSNQTINYTDATEQGTKFYVLAFDAAFATSDACYKWDSVLVVSNPTPTATLGGQAIYCEGATVAPITVEFAGGKAEYTFTSTFTTGGLGVTSGTTASSKANLTGTTLPSAPGTYTYELKEFTDANGCAGTLPATASQTITINPTPKATLNATKTEYCASEKSATGISLSLEAETGISLTGASYEWFKGGVSQGAASPTATTLNNATAGIYTCKITLNGCTFTSNAITITEHENPVYTIGPDKIGCISELNAHTVTVQFTKGASPVNFTIDGKTYTTDATGKSEITGWTGDAAGIIYTLSDIKDANKCEGTSAASVKITLVTPPGITLKTDKIDFCEGTKTSIDIRSRFSLDGSLTANESLKYTVVSGGGTLSAATGDGSLTPVNLSNLAAGVHKVQVEIAGSASNACPVSATVEFEVYELPTATIAPAEACQKAALTLTATPAKGSAPYTYKNWKLDTGGSVSGGTGATTNVLTSTVAGIYSASVTVVDNNGCEATSAPATVKIKEIPTVSVIPNQTLCAGENTTLITFTGTPAASAIDYAWTATNTTTGIAANGSEYIASFTAQNATNAAITSTITVTPTLNGCIGEATPVTTITVNPNPTFTIAPSAASACEVNTLNPSKDITITVTPTAPTTAAQMGNTTGFAYSGITGINTSTGAFSTTGLSSGQKTISVHYTDANNCKGSAETTFTINTPPTVTLTAPAEVCWNASNLALVGAPSGGEFSSSNGTVNASTGEYSPFAAGGTQNFSYLYEDDKGCKGDATTSVTSVAVTQPTLVEKVIQIQSNGNFTAGENTNLTATLPSGANAIEWFANGNCDALTTSGILFEGLTYQTGKTEADGKGTYPYQIRATKQIAGNETCYSECQAAILNITSCPAQTPEAKNAHFCLGETASLEATVFADPAKVAWFDKNPVGLTGNTTTFPQNGVTILGTGTTYTSANQTASTQTLYVAEYDKDNDCWSSGGIVTLSIHNKPNVTITVDNTNGDTYFCATDAKRNENPIKFKLTPDPSTLSSSSSFTFDQSGSSWKGFTPNIGRSWDATADPWTNGDTQRDMKVIYTITEKHGSSDEIQASCPNQNDLTVTAQFTPAPPQPADKYWLISDIANIPNTFVTAAVQAPGIRMNWYDTDKTTGLQNNSTTYSNIGNITQQIDSDAKAHGAPFTKVFNITQFNARGCESAQTPVNLILVDCPFQAPDLTPNASCKKELPGAGLAIKAEKAPTTATGAATPTPSQWNWYADNNGTAGALISGAPNAGGDNSTYNSPAQSTTTYWVSYIAREANSGQTCESQKAAVTLTVFADPVIASISQAKNGILCNYDDANMLTANVTRNNTTGTTAEQNIWTIVGHANGIEPGNNSEPNSYALFNPSTWGETTATYTVKYQVTNNNGCKDEKTITIPVQYVPAPTTVDYKQAPSAPGPVVVKAESLETAANGFQRVEWFATAVSQTTTAGVLTNGTQNPFPTGDPANVEITAPGKQYFVRQVVNGCNSATTPATVIIQCPVPAPLTTDRIICDYFANPELTVQGGQWLQGARPTTHAPVFNFYSAQTGGTLIGTATASSAASTTATWTPTTLDKTQNQVTYWVSESNAGAQPAACEGPRTALTIQIRRAQSVTINTPVSICEYEITPAFTVSGNTAGSVIEWYNAAPSRVQGAESPSDYVGLGTNGSVTPSWSGANAYTIWATQRISDRLASTGETVSCVSTADSKSFVIKPQPAKPVLVGNENCAGSAAALLTAINPTGTITWFRENATSSIGSGNSYQPSDVAVGTYFYSARQTVNGCQSDTATTYFRVKAIPAKPVVSITKDRICSYDEDPYLSATLATVSTAIDKTAKITWSSSSNGVGYLPQFDGLGVGTPFQAKRDINTTLTYYARQEVEGCISPSSEVKAYTIVADLPAPTNTAAAMCEGASIPYLRTSSNRANWYEQASTVKPYTPAGSPLNASPSASFAPASITATTTYYVQDVSPEGCLSPTSPVTLTVIPMPPLNIGSNIDFCIYNSGKVFATGLEPKPTSPANITWRVTAAGTPFNRPLATQSDANDNYFVQLDNSILPTAGEYTLRAVYTVTEGNTTCASRQQEITVTVNDRPNAPIVASKIICQGTTLDPIQAFGSPLITWEFIEHKPAENSAKKQELPPHVGDTYDFNRFNLPSIEVGQYFFTLVDTDASTGCESNRTQLSFEVAPQAQTKIVGATTICATTALEEPYAIEVVPTTKSNYYWSTSGNVYNFSKDGNPYSPSRYVDWHDAGIDTVYVYERTWAGCEGFDTLVVQVAP